ncbi:MAG: putative fatty-acid--CoA ligase, partial [Ilumatobacteraceae bacterium]|nr:putative fatty-acid--CoA ligase [Ilumatobacteraceae bacterium]
MITKQGRSGRVPPFPMDGIGRAADGVLRYTSLPESVVAMLRRSVERDPHGEAIVEVGGERLEFRTLWERAARVAGGLRAAGVRRGDRVAIHLPNGVPWVTAFFGSQLAGAVAVPVNTRFSPAEVRYVVADCGASYVVEPGAALPDGTPFAVDDLSLGDLAAIFYTSGTTGFPKGALLAHECLLATCENRTRVTGTGKDLALRNLVSVPLFHVTGTCSQLMFTVSRGGTTVIMPAFSVQPFLHAIAEERINIATSVPAIWWLAINQPNFADFDVAGLRHLSYGGAPMAPELVGRVREAFPNARLGNGFGLTETTAIATFLPNEWCELRPETVGFAAPVVEVDLLDV